jgi:tyrosyl-tRNA synthetase
MARYMTLLTEAPTDEVAAAKSGKIHPMEAKKRLAGTIVEEYHGAAARQKALNYFESKFQRREVPAEARVYRIAEPMWICELMKQLNFAPSTSEARRLLGQGAVRIDGRTISDVNFRFTPGDDHVIEVGKRRVAKIEK